MPILLAHAMEDSTDIVGISGGGVESLTPPPLGTPRSALYLECPNVMKTYSFILP